MGRSHRAGVDGGVGHPRVRRLATSETTRDCLFLGLVMVVSFLPYLGGLGLYSDDWAFLGALDTAGDRSPATLLLTQWHATANLPMRPTQVAHQALLYWLFGLHPLPYHLSNAVVLTSMVTLLYLVLREIGLPRLPALAAPTVFALLPNAATTRFWFAAFGYPLSLAAYLLSLYANLRGLRARGRTIWAWKVVALLGLAVGGLGYEVVLPLFVASLALLWYVGFRTGRQTPAKSLGRVGMWVFLGADVLILGLVLAYKAVTAVGAGISGSYPKHLAWVVTGAVTTNYGTFGVDMARAVRWSLAVTGTSVLIVGIGLALIIFVYLRNAGRSDGASSEKARTTEHRSRRILEWASWPRRREWAGLVGVGVGVFLLGYAIFLTNARIIFTSTGPNNRVAIAGAAGMALTVVGMFGLIGGIRPLFGRYRVTIFSFLVALMALAGFLVTNGLADMWTRAWQREQTILADIQARLPRPESRTAVILDGVCPYVGPAVVFESNWDLAGALRSKYDDPTIHADVTTGNFHIGEDGLTTTIYGTQRAFYPYGPRLLVYDARHDAVHPLPDAETARKYFSSRSPDRECPGSPGIGVPFLPLDIRFRQWELRYFAR
jgi:hypothetical protein